MTDVRAEGAASGLGFGYHMPYPTQEESAHYRRELGWEERIELLNQGYHRGCYLEPCYTIEEFARLVSKRNPRDPTGGVHSLDKDVVVPWLRDVVGDAVLADTIGRVFASGAPMPEVVDQVRVIVNTRINQYYEAFDDSDEF